MNLLIKFFHELFEVPMCKIGWQTGSESMSTGLLSKCVQQQTGPEQSQESIQVFHVGKRDPGTWCDLLPLKKLELEVEL